MSYWLVLALVPAAVLFVASLVYLCSTASVYRVTQGALFVTTARVRVNAFLDAVPMRKGQLLVDLGCGDGRVLKWAYERYGVRGIGYELNPLAYMAARLRCRRVREIEIKRENFLDADLSEADVVFCYLFPDVMNRLVRRIPVAVKPGATVVSANFPLPGCPASRILRPESLLHGEPIYIYQAGPEAPAPFSSPVHPL